MMRVLIQRVLNGNVKVEQKVVGAIDKGYVLLVGFKVGDDLKIIDRMIEKLIHLRLFEDENGRLNHSILEKGYDILSISQFTLYADTRKGRRPGFTLAMPAAKANEYFNAFNEKLKHYLRVETGIFQTDMKVELVNDGPVTVLLDSDELFG